MTGRYECACSGMVPVQQSRNYGANTDIRNLHGNLFCCNSAHWVEDIILLEMVRASERHTGAPESCSMCKIILLTCHLQNARWKMLCITKDVFWGWSYMTHTFAICYLLSGHL